MWSSSTRRSIRTISKRNTWRSFLLNQEICYRLEGHLSQAYVYRWMSLLRAGIVSCFMIRNWKSSYWLIWEASMERSFRLRRVPWSDPIIQTLEFRSKMFQLTLMQKEPNPFKSVPITIQVTNSLKIKLTSWKNKIGSFLCDLLLFVFSYMSLFGKYFTQYLNQ